MVISLEAVGTDTETYRAFLTRPAPRLAVSFAATSTYVQRWRGEHAVCAPTSCDNREDAW
jgi:hypothetical protein